MSPRRAEVVQALGEHVRRCGTAGPRVAIDGPTAAGRSSLAVDLAGWQSDHGAPVLLDAPRLTPEP